MMRRVKLFCSLAMLLTSQIALAVSYPLPPDGSRLVGSPLTMIVPDKNTQPLETFAAQYGLGLSNMLEANPGVDCLSTQVPGSTLVIPQQLILPATVREGIVINVAEMRLYYYPSGGNTVEILPIGIGQAGRETPRNWVTSVQRKQEAPTWSPTPIPDVNMPEGERACPRLFLRGRKTQWGLYAIYIGKLYAIHGTNANFGIGLRVSQGCIRLRNDDIEYLFDNVPVVRVCN
ncbi:L,D-transpeptidase family protein [Citrobacter enshiensis]|uniref:L,D-transpeptidase family protein n=1 Tax=Citrobacter enshiensis TaxID=2971264 RepID=UPI0023E762CA|nr:L,D-transpeptidase family protein [Citrobacter enshiensis]WET42257.1 L,D-transpeptidase family protein [Citrobacter enshiensis]